MRICNLLSHLRAWCLALSLTALIGAPASADDVVYDSLSGAVFGGGSVLQPPGHQLGEDILLGYYSASVDKIEYMLRSFSTNTFVEFKIHLYAFDRPDGSYLPGSTIWSSPNISLTVPQTPQVYSIDVPGIVVPKRFAWAIETISPLNTGVGFPGVPAATTGKSIATLRYNPTFTPEPWIWERRMLPQAYGLRISGTAIVIPEPTSGCIVGLGLLSAVGLCRFRTSGCALPIKKLCELVGV